MNSPDEAEAKVGRLRPTFFCVSSFALLPFGSFWPLFTADLRANDKVAPRLTRCVKYNQRIGITRMIEGPFRACASLVSAFPPASLSPLPSRPRMSNPTTIPQEKPQLARALEKNDAIQGTVERSAQELDLVNSVLEKEIPVDVKKGDVAMALEKTAELEDQMQISADELAHVNELLQQEIAEREELEKKLRNAENELAKKDSAARS